MIGTDYGHHDPSSELNAIRLLRKDRRIGPETIEKYSRSIRESFTAID